MVYESDDRWMEGQGRQAGRQTSLRIDFCAGTSKKSRAFFGSLSQSPRKSNG